MKKEFLYNALLFACVWIAFLFGSGITEHLHKLPMGVHQSAQCDRASLAQNYFHGGMHFLYPEVNENRCIDGIVSCELPLPSYLAAACFHFSDNPSFAFRLISLLFISLGMFALYLLFESRMSKLLALCLVLLLQSSPILLFYSANFLPDIVSLGLALVAWYLFFELFIEHAYRPNQNLGIQTVLFVLSLGLAIAIKSTSIIQMACMLGLWLFSKISYFKIKLLNPGRLMISLLIAFAIPLTWYLWSKHLSLTHNSQYFMMRIPESESWAKYQEAWAVYLANWPSQALSYPLIYLALGFWILTIFLKKHIQRELYVLSLLNAFGSLLFLTVMMEQFKYHDYYAICLFPAFALNFLALHNAASKIKPSFWWFKTALFIAVLLACNFQFNTGRKNLEERYTEGNYWEQSHHRSVDLDSFRMRINALGVNRNSCVLVGYDPSPNNMLFLLQLRGHRLSKDHDQNRINDILFGSHPQYFISNDSLLSEQIKATALQCQLELKYKYLELYRLGYDSLSQKKSQ